MLKRIIPAKCFPNLKCLLLADGYYHTLNISFCSLGREALLLGLISLGIQKNNSVIVPAYMCSSTIQPLKEYGFKLVFIDVEKDLSLSVAMVKQAIRENSSIKALLVVHYFGMTQNIDGIVEACHDYGIKVVEDASHSFMSQLLRDRVDIKGDIEIFSIRKSLPVVDGGALRINNSEYSPIKTCNSQCVSITDDIRYLVLRLFEKLATGLGINIYGQLINDIKIKLRSKVNAEVHDFNVEACQPSMQLKKYLGNEKYLQSVQHKITNNFNQLSKALKSLGFDLFVDSIEDGIIPQACIVYDSKGGLTDHLRFHGIGVWQWPGEEMPEEVVQNSSRYPNAILFDKKLVLLPIHQSIGNKQINHIIQVLSGWQR